MKANPNNLNYYQKHKQERLEYQKKYSQRPKIKERTKKYKQKYYQDNKEKIETKKKEWNKNNEEKMKKYQQNYYQENKEKYKNHQKTFFQNHPEKIKIYRKNSFEKIKQRRRKHPEKIIAQNLARQIKIPKGQSCQICYDEPAKIKHHWRYDHPFQINFLCIDCHKIIHRREKFVP